MTAMSSSTWAANKERALFVVSTVLLLAGGAAWVLSEATAATVSGSPARCWAWSSRWAGRRRGPARPASVDVIAVLALAGALVVDEPFAGAMITVMLASGQLLEARAEARARRELSLLVERAPRTARRRVDGGVVEVPVDESSPGTGCWSAPERSSRWTGGCSPPRCWTSRR